MNPFGSSISRLPGKLLILPMTQSRSCGNDVEMCFGLLTSGQCYSLPQSDTKIDQIG